MSTIRTLRFTGGPLDGDTQVCDQPFDVSPGEAIKIENGHDCYLMTSFAGEVAQFKFVGPAGSLPSGAPVA